MKPAKTHPPSRRAISPGAREFSVLIVNRQRRHVIPTARIRAVLEGAASALEVAGQVAVVFASDPFVRRLNRDYRFKDKPTDVLSFPGPGEDMGLGDVIISVETASANADRAGHSLDHELLVLALHGFLHAIGFDHEADNGEMTALERQLRARLITRHGGRAAA